LMKQPSQKPMIPAPLLISNDWRHHNVFLISGHSIANPIFFCIYLLFTGCLGVCFSH
jgi:hypothetical protein